MIEGFVPDSRPDVLFLAHRIPFPPTKGDKIRSFNLLVHLAARFRVHLGTFVDDPADVGFEESLDRYCASSIVIRLRPAMRRLLSLRALFTGEPITLPYYRNAALQRWVDATVARYDIRRLLVFSSSMAQYVLGPAFADKRKVFDLVDVDSDKWAQYATHKGVLTAWLYRREAARLAEVEERVARAGGLTTLVSEQEAEFLRQRIGSSACSVAGVPNGVDTEFFAPRDDLAPPYGSDHPSIVFTGAMDYWANQDAVKWFAADIMPTVRSRFPTSVFYVVGRNPTREVKRLEGGGVVVTGAVGDVRPYLQHADVVVAPMRIARGIQNKVLEGMAMARPVVATSRSLEGIDARPGEEVLVADDRLAYVDRIGEVLGGSWPELGKRARERVVETYSWNANLAPISKFLGAP